MLRHIRKPKVTTIRLEQPFWTAIDNLAAAHGIHWRELVGQMLEAKQQGQGAASWLRVCCLSWPAESE
jgi:predicted DNA-binding ribbon-helix-helix protein